MKNNILMNIIQTNSSCMIIPHQSPDGDCLGSSYALSHFLDNANCHNVIVMDDIIPTNYKFLEKDNMVSSKSLLEAACPFDYILALDTSSKDRLGCDPQLLTLGNQIVVIDHHKTNDAYGDVNIVQMLSSVGEILYNMMDDTGMKISNDVAIGLYTSIVTDTGEFRYSNTESTTLKAVAHLFETGFDFETINRHIYSNQPLGKVLLRSKALSDIHLYAAQSIAVMQVTQERLETLNCEMFHSDGIVEAGRDIEGVEVSVLLKEMENNIIKVSMRSKAYIDVSEVSLIFGGGGHERAAGCSISGNIDEVEKQIVTLLKERLQ